MTTIFKEAREREKKGYGYNSFRSLMLWSSRNTAWNNISIHYGVRRSEIWQVLPVWNTSNNCKRSLMFGFWFLFFEVAYYRKNNSYYLQKWPLFRTHFIGRLYQLLF